MDRNFIKRNEKIMGIISVIAGIATVILLYCSIIITNLKGFEKGKKFLFIALIPLIICFVFKTEDVEMALRFIFGFAMIYPALISILSIFNLSDKEARTLAFVNLISLVMCVIMLLASGMSFSSGFSSGGSGKKCVFCEKRTATHGNYCSDCYDATHPD